DPELLGVRPELRAAGPHVRAQLGLEPSCAPLARLGLVSRVSQPVSREHVHDESRAAPRAAAEACPRTGLRLDRPHLPPPPAPCYVVVLRRARRRSRLHNWPDRLLYAAQGPEYARHVGPVGGLHGRSSGPSRPRLGGAAF